MAAGIDTVNLALLSIASVTNLILAVLIFIYSKKKQSWWFAGVIIAVVGWTIVNYLADNTQNPEWALVWTKMTFSTTAFVAWFLFLFALRDKGISVKKLRTLRDESSPGIRLADALAGVTRAYYDDPKGKAAPLWKKIRHKITAQLVGGQVDE